MNTYHTPVAEAQLRLLAGGSIASAKPMSALHTGGAVKVATTVFAMPEGVAANDRIAVCTIPKGAKVLPLLSYVVSEGLLVACSLSLGTVDVPAKWMTTIDVKLPGMNSCKAISGIIANDVKEAPTVVYATITGTPVAQAGQRLFFQVAYAIQ